MEKPPEVWTAIDEWDYTMRLRDEIARDVMRDVLQAKCSLPPKEVAHISYMVAEAMLEARMENMNGAS